MFSDLVEDEQTLEGLFRAAMTEGWFVLHCKLLLMILAQYIGP